MGWKAAIHSTVADKGPEAFHAFDAAVARSDAENVLGRKQVCYLWKLWGGRAPLVYPLRFTATWILSALMRCAMAALGQAETSRKCSASAAMRARHSLPSSGESA